MTREILERIMAFLMEKFRGIIVSEPIIIRRRLRVYLDDGSIIDIRYPNNYEYSLHWQGKRKIIRIDTAPHHPHLRSHPRHIHLFNEDNVIDDEITSFNLDPTENVEKFMLFIIEKRKDP